MPCVVGRRQPDVPIRPRKIHRAHDTVQYGERSATGLRSVLRVCPICGAFEAIDKRIAVIGDGERGEQEARFVRTYSERVRYLYIGPQVDEGRRQRLHDRGIELIETDLAQLTIKADALELAGPRVSNRVFDVCNAALGFSPRIELATM